MKRLLEDIRGRFLVHYADDWSFAAKHPLKVLSSALYMFFANVLPAIAFGQYLAKATSGTLGIPRVLMSTGISGIVYSLAAGQPLIIVGVTGPISIFSEAVFKVTEQLEYDFLRFYSVTLFWSGVITSALALSGACHRIVSLISRFICEIFGVMIALIYIYEAFRLVGEEAHEYGASVKTLYFIIIFILSALGMLYLAQARQWQVGVKAFRVLCADYAVAMTVLLGTVIPLAIRSLDYSKVVVPPLSSKYLVEFWNVSVAEWFLAIVPGLILTALVFFDHNVSSLLAQRPELNLVKGPAYELDFLVVGLSMFICAFMGLPPSHGLIPQAPLHVLSLVKKRRIKILKLMDAETDSQRPLEGEKATSGAAAASSQSDAAEASSNQIDVPRVASPTIIAIEESAREEIDIYPLAVSANAHGQGRITPAIEGQGQWEETETIQRFVVENRVTNLIQSVLILLILIPEITSIISEIPVAVISGLFFFMGAESFYNNQFATRFKLLITDPQLRQSEFLEFMSFWKMTQFTLWQVVFLIIITAITIFGGVASISFPILILLLIPIRLYLFPKMFSEQEIEKLDSW